jgi:aminopeptidase N
MKFTLTPVLCFLITAMLVSSVATAQKNDLFYHPVQNKSTAASLVSGQGSNIDVVYQRCNWRIHPDSPSTTAPVKYIRGNVTTYFTTRVDNVSQITFDFNNVHTIDSVKYHGAKLTAGNVVWSTAKIIQLTFPSTIALTGTLDSLTIFYRGTPPAISGEAYGYQKGGTSSNNYISTLSESYEDRDWWPCKHDMTDKIDSMDINVSVPSTFWVAANGKLIDSAISGSSRTFKFKHRYPIASFLVSLGVAKYNRYYRGTVNVGGTNVPVVYNLFPGKSTSTYNNILTALDKSKTELATFSTKYGDYPFKNEKFGFYEFGWPGGMEHQTFCAMGSSVLTSWSTIAHELAHQWFGDKVTCATWSDLWVNEGFARYNEILAAELISGLTNPITYRGSIKTTARATSTTPIFISDITSSNSIWTANNNNAVYERGCMVVSMLRTLLGDTKFFQACQDYLNDPLLAYKAAATPDAERNFENQFGIDMSHFFNAWIYGAGTPSYTVNWSTTGNNVTAQLTQTRTAGSTVPYFPMPVVLKVANTGNTSSTTLIVYDRGDSIFVAGNGAGVAVAGNTVSFPLTFAPATMSFDPENVTMATGTTTKVTPFARPTITETKISYTKTQVYPNPANNEITITRSHTKVNSSVVITDVNGKTVLKKTITSAIEKVNIQQLVNGTYILQVIEDGATIKSEKLIIAH